MLFLKHMRNRVATTVFLWAVVLPGSILAQCREKQSLGVSPTFSPNSSHILIGDAGRRRIWTGGIRYQHCLLENRRLTLSYDATFSPLYQEKDPTLIGEILSTGGSFVEIPLPPTRVVSPNGASLGNSIGAGSSTPIRPVYGREFTYGISGTPIGAIVKSPLGPRVAWSFATDLGFVVTSRDIPIENSTRFNYLFDIGPGLEFLIKPQTHLATEYIYRHISNANMGSTNIGIDAGTIRLTISRSW